MNFLKKLLMLNRIRISQSNLTIISYALKTHNSLAIFHFKHL